MTTPLSTSDHDDYDPEHEYDYEPARPAFCDDYAAHEAHVYGALNGETYRCGGFTHADAVALDEMAAAPACEHGMSAWLCAGPGHYPADAR